MLNKINCYKYRSYMTCNAKVTHIVYSLNTCHFRCTPCSLPINQHGFHCTRFALYMPSRMDKSTVHLNVAN